MMVWYIMQRRAVRAGARKQERLLPLPLLLLLLLLQVPVCHRGCAASAAYVLCFDVGAGASSVFLCSRDRCQRTGSYDCDLAK